MHSEARKSHARRTEQHRARAGSNARLRLPRGAHASGGSCAARTRPDGRFHCPNHLPTLAAPLRCPSPTLPHTSAGRAASGVPASQPANVLFPLHSEKVCKGVVVVRSVGPPCRRRGASTLRGPDGPQREQMVAPARATPMWPGRTLTGGAAHELAVSGDGVFLPLGHGTDACRRW